MTDTDNKYIENVVIKLSRKYKDELVAYLQKKISEKDFEIGQLNSEIQHLNHRLNEKEDTKRINRSAKIEARKNELFAQRTVEIDAIRKENKRLRNNNIELIIKLNKINNANSGSVSDPESI